MEGLKNMRSVKNQNEQSIELMNKKSVSETMMTPMVWKRAIFVWVQWWRSSEEERKSNMVHLPETLRGCFNLFHHKDGKDDGRKHEYTSDKETYFYSIQINCHREKQRLPTIVYCCCYNHWKVFLKFIKQILEWLSETQHHHFWNAGVFFLGSVVGFRYCFTPSCNG